MKSPISFLFLVYILLSSIFAQGKIKDILASQGYSPIPLRTFYSGHMTVQAKINGVTGTFIIDTGAGFFIDKEKAKKFNFSNIYRKTVSGGVHKGNVTSQIKVAKSVVIGSVELKNVNVSISTSRLFQASLNAQMTAIDGLLGSSVLKPAHAIIDYSTATLYVK